MLPAATHTGVAVFIPIALFEPAACTAQAGREPHSDCKSKHQIRSGPRT